MALINCPECKQEISDTCKVCPKCGYRLKKAVNVITIKDKSKLIKIIAIAVAVLVVILLKTTSIKSQYKQTVRLLKCNTSTEVHDYLIKHCYCLGGDSVMSQVSTSWSYVVYNNVVVDKQCLKCVAYNDGSIDIYIEGATLQKVKKYEKLLIKLYGSKYTMDSGSDYNRLIWNNGVIFKTKPNGNNYDILIETDKDN